MDDTTSNLMPINMQEVETKLKWNLAHNRSATEDTVILEAILENVRTMLVDALEGPYWTAEWKDGHNSIVITDIIGKKVGVLVPDSDSFIADFKNNSPKLIMKLNKEIQKIVKNN